MLKVSWIVTPHPSCYNRDMHYLYLLQSELDKSLYIGQTSDLKRRFAEHNSGQSQSTKAKKPWKLIYYEAYLDPNLALKREKQLKRFAKSYTMLKKRIGL